MTDLSPNSTVADLISYLQKQKDLAEQQERDIKSRLKANSDVISALTFRYRNNAHEVACSELLKPSTLNNLRSRDRKSTIDDRNFILNACTEAGIAAPAYSITRESTIEDFREAIMAKSVEPSEDGRVLHAGTYHKLHSSLEHINEHQALTGKIFNTVADIVDHPQEATSALLKTPYTGQGTVKLLFRFLSETGIQSQHAIDGSHSR